MQPTVAPTPSTVYAPPAHPTPAPPVPSAPRAPDGHAAPTPDVQVRITALDGVRGLGFIMVLMYHVMYFMHAPHSGRYRHPVVDVVAFAVARLGWVALELFFVLSGFLITRILLDAKGKDRYFARFYARRSLRIFPLYLLALALLFFVLPAIDAPTAESLAAFPQVRWWSFFYGMNVLIALKGWSTVPLAMQHLWSLSIEEQYYLLWPLAVYLLTPRGALRTCLGLIGFGVVLRALVWAFFAPLSAHVPDIGGAVYTFTFTRLDSIAVGSAMAVVMMTPRGTAGVARWAKWLVAPSFAAFVALTVMSRGADAQLVPSILLALPVGALLSGSVIGTVLTSRGWLTRLFEFRPFRWLGRYSYALYIVHQPVAILLRNHGVTTRSVPRFHGSELPGFALMTLAVGGISLALALLSWHLFEKRFLALKARWPVAA